MSIFNKEFINFANEPLFFGKGRNIARLDLQVNESIMKKSEKALGLTWFPNDFSYVNDAKDYNNMDVLLKVLYLKNLKFQQLLDSIATRTVLEVFKPITTSPQLEHWWTIHGFQEDVHSGTYAEVIKALPVNATKIFDDIMVNPNILSRAKDIIDRFEDTYKWNAKRTLQTDDYDFEAHKKSLVMSMFALNILEGGLFKTSFITTFAYAENGMMESTGKAVGRISMDEDNHLGMTQWILTQLKKDIEYKYIFIDNKNEILDMYKKAYKADMLWIDYLFEDDAKILGLNANILKQYAQYNIYKVMNAIGLDNIVDKISNPCSWANKFTKTANLQVALNETDGTNYLLGKIDKHISNEDWDSFK